MTDVIRLKSRIRDMGIKKSFIAEKMGISYQGYLKKENGESEFLQSEISVLKMILNLRNKEVSEIFLSDE